MSLYRIDKFVVPETAREEFLKRVRETHRILCRQPGFIRVVVRQIAGPGRFNLVTLAKWEKDSKSAGNHETT